MIVTVGTARTYTAGGRRFLTPAATYRRAAWDRMRDSDLDRHASP